MKNNISSATTKQWVKFSIAAVLIIFFTFWSGSAWWLILLPFVFDIYVSKFIPWGFWRNIKNKAVRTVFEWIDAILFALIAVYLINTFFFQNYKIPTSSLEKTLLVGDFLFVSKVAYGPRNPMTPLSFPLAQHTLPVLNTKSYIEKPQWKYKRLKGFGNVEIHDLVVFNFPTGDTVALKQQNPDYYTLCALYGREMVNTNKDLFGDIVYRPVDRRENYVKRCVALPGDTLQVIDNQIYVNGQKENDVPGLQLNYFVQTNGQEFSQKVLKDLGVSVEDQRYVNNPRLLTEQQKRRVNRELDYLGFESDSTTGNQNPVYHMPLTAGMLQQMRNLPAIKQIIVEKDYNTQVTFPLGNDKWTRDDYGPIWIPRKGATINLNMENLPLYERVIHNYEGNSLEVKDSIIYINGQEATTYTFNMDYYWMMGDNRHNSADSRYWGFVPEDHIVGRPVFVWLSLDKDKGLFDGKIRFNRFFKNAKH